MDLIRSPGIGSCGHLELVDLMEALEFVEAYGSDSTQGLSA